MNASLSVSPWRHSFPIVLFLLFAGFLVGATVLYQPSWGLMDDSQNIKFLQQTNVDSDIKTYWSGIFMKQGGFIRPVYRLWVQHVYAVFLNFPLGMYLLVIVLNLSFLLLWGVVIYDYYQVHPDDRNIVIFWYPLLAFLFTPLWNVFMYLSVQEKFVIWFSAIALFSFRRAYVKNSMFYFVASLVSIALGVMSKPTCCYLMMIFFAYAALDLLLFKENRKMSWLYVSILTITLMGYFWFVLSTQLNTEYSGRYKMGLNVSAILGKIIAGPIYIKVLLMASIACFFGQLFWFVKKRQPWSAMPIVFALGLATYILLLTPWGYLTYLLSALAPLAIAVGFPVYYGLIRWREMHALVQGVCVVLLAVIAGGFILPSIQRMGTIHKTVTFLESHARADHAYYYPPPYIESSKALGFLSGTHVEYASRAKIMAKHINKDKIFLITDKFSGPVELINLEMGEMIYQNPYWRIYQMYKKADHQMKFQSVFPKAPLERLKEHIKAL